MSTLVLIAAVLAGLIAMILGFHALGTDGADWGGWLALSLVLFEISQLVGDGLPNLNRSRRDG